MSARLTALTTFCAVSFAILATLTAALYTSNAASERQLRQRIDAFSSRALLRAEKVTAEAMEALHQLEPYNGTPCTNEHLQSLR
ncbi:MAG: CSS-motif domain-containing protein, partial [Paraburkholderia sp.]|nr:CSS-motif domain-containing protein [Paraburkholderia sp.]